MACSPEIARANGKLGGRPRLEATLIRAAMHKALEDHAEELVEVVLGKALGGDLAALREMLDRVNGKPVQRNAFTDSDGVDRPIPILDVFRDNGDKKDSGDVQEDSGGAGRDIGQQDGQHTAVPN